MRKNIISENRLRELVNESIYEVLNESEFDEGFGHWLGQTYQGIKNKWNNFKKDFEAGRDKARFDNKDYNGYSHFGDEENELRKMNHGGYGNYRYNLEKSRNQEARGEDDSTTEPTNISNDNFQPHPSLVNQQQSNGGETDNTQQNQIKNNSVAQTRGNKGYEQLSSKEQDIELRRVSNELKKNGIEPIMKDGKIVNFRPINGSLTPEQNALIQQAKRNPIVSKFLMENEIKKLKSQLNELMESYKRISRK
jgi:hypothetical protein